MPPLGIPAFSRRQTITGEVTLDSGIVETPKMTLMFDEEGRLDLDSLTLKDEGFDPEKFGAQLRGSGARTPPPQADLPPETKIPSMNIVILLCGSRGDVQPFLAFGNYLKEKGHRVRIGTHDM